MAELSVDIDINTQQSVSNVKKLGDAFSDAAKELLEIVDAGKRAGKSNDDIARDISKAYKVELAKAEDAVDKLDDALDDLRRTGGRSGDEAAESLEDVERAARRADDAVDDIGNSGERGLGKLRATSAEVGQEIRQNLGEGIANAARGDFAGLADTIGDTLGGAVAGIGGLGTAAVGVAGALGLGAIVGVIQSMAAESEKTKEIASENFRQMAEEGVESWQSVQSQMQRLTSAYDQHEGEIKRIAELTGLSFEDVAGAWAGIPDKVSLVDAAYGDMVSNLENTFGVTREGIDATVKGWEGIMGPLNNVVTGYDQAKQKAQILSEQQTRMWAQAINEAESATKEVDEFGNTLYTLPSGEQVVIDAETGQATTDVSTFKGDLDGVPETVTSRLKVVVDDSAVRNYRPPVLYIEGRVIPKTGGKLPV